MYCAFWKFCIPIIMLVFVFPLSPFFVSHAFLLCFLFLSTLISSFFFVISNFSFPHLFFSVLSVSSLIISPPFFHPCVSPLWFISPLLHYFTWTGGRAAGLLRPCVRGGNHRGDVWCGRMYSLAQCRATPTTAEQDGLFACPLGCPQHLLGKEHERTTTPPTCTSSASQVGARTSLILVVVLKKFLKRGHLWVSSVQH